MPPPAPRVATESIGVPMSCPAMRPESVSSIRPSAITAMSVEVPPMSNVTTLGRPTSAPSARPDTAPAAGPDSRVWLGNRAPSPIRISPPCDCIRNSWGVSIPASSSASPRRSR